MNLLSAPKRAIEGWAPSVCSRRSSHGAAILWLALSQHVSLAYLGVPAAIFIGLVVAHSRLDRTRKTAKRAVDYYQRGLARLDDKWASAGETGERFRDPAHPYADDLDLFGAGSLFQLLNIARTATGETTLARWCGARGQRTKCSRARPPVEELRNRLDLREDLALLGQDFRASGHPEPWQNGALDATSPSPAGCAGSRPFRGRRRWSAGRLFRRRSRRPSPAHRLHRHGLASKACWCSRCANASPKWCSRHRQPGHDLALLARRASAAWKRNSFSSPKLATLCARTLMLPVSPLRNASPNCSV